MARSSSPLAGVPSEVLTHDGRFVDGGLDAFGEIVAWLAAVGCDS